MRAILPLLLILAGCSSTSTVATADGSAYQVDCGGLFGSGLFGSKLECNVRANQICPSGFNPISSPPGHLVFTCSKRPIPATAPI